MGPYTSVNQCMKDKSMTPNSLHFDALSTVVAVIKDDQAHNTSACVIGSKWITLDRGNET